MIRKRFCNTSAITGKAYPLVSPARSAMCSNHIASSYTRAIVFLCAPLTHREPHRSIAFTGRNSPLKARWKRGLS